MGGNVVSWDSCPQSTGLGSHASKFNKLGDKLVGGGSHALRASLISLAISQADSSTDQF